MVYIIMMTISLIFACISEEGKKRKRMNLYKLTGFLSFLPSFFVSAFRGYTVGTDTDGTYLSIYNIALRNHMEVRDAGYYYLNRAAILLFHNFTGVLVLTSLIFCGISFYCIYKYSKHPAMSVLLFFATNVYFSSMNMIRQSIAMVFFVVSFGFIEKRKTVSYYACVALSASFHTIGLGYIPVYFLWNVKLNIKRIFIIIVGVFISSQAISFIIEHFIITSSYFSLYFAWYYKSAYFTGDVHIISLLISALLFALMIYVYPKAKDNKRYNFYLWLQLISVCSLLLSGKVPLMNRVSLIFSFAQFIYLPEIMDYISESRTRFFARAGVCGGFVAYMITTIFVMGYEGVLPYQSILGK